MANDDDLLTFADEAPASTEWSSTAWRILIVDDEPQVHTVTTLALGDLRVDGMPLAFDHAYDGAEARAKLASQRYALVLLDVVMASDDDGLRVVRWLRREQADRLTRVMLRTGQPGLAPEREVMLEYDINDYQPKAELSSQRLATSVIGAIRSYRDLCTIAEQKRGLEQIVEATATLFDRRSTEQLVSGVLQQLAGLLGPAESAMFFLGPESDVEEATRAVILAATGRFTELLGKPARAALTPERTAAVEALVSRRENGGGPGWIVYSMARSQAAETLRAAVYIESGATGDAWNARLLELFCTNAAVAFENQRLAAEQYRLLEAFGRFVPRRMLDAIGIHDVTRVAVGDQVQRDMTVMFVDVRSFTPLAERCGSREAFRVLNRLFAEIVPIVHATGGLVDKYLGDGLLSLYPEAPERVLEAAVDILRAVDEASREELDVLGVTLDVGIGIHRGPTTLGLVGAHDRLESTVISDAVNVASRLERLTRVYGARIIASAEALAHGGPWFEQARTLGTQSVRGKTTAVRCFEVFAADPPVTRARKASTRPAFEAAVDALSAGRYSEASRGFARVLELDPTDPAALELAEAARRGVAI